MQVTLEQHKEAAEAAREAAERAWLAQRAAAGALQDAVSQAAAREAALVAAHKEQVGVCVWEGGARCGWEVGACGDLRLSCQRRARSRCARLLRPLASATGLRSP